MVSVCCEVVYGSGNEGYLAVKMVVFQQGRAVVRNNDQASRGVKRRGSSTFFFHITEENIVTKKNVVTLFP